MTNVYDRAYAAYGSDAYGTVNLAVDIPSSSQHYLLVFAIRGATVSVTAGGVALTKLGGIAPTENVHGIDVFGIFSPDSGNGVSIQITNTYAAFAYSLDDCSVCAIAAAQNKSASFTYTLKFSSILSVFSDEQSGMFLDCATANVVAGANLITYSLDAGSGQTPTYNVVMSSRKRAIASDKAAAENINMEEKVNATKDDGALSYAYLAHIVVRATKPTLPFMGRGYIIQ